MTKKRTVRIDPDDRTVLIGSDAEVNGALKIAWSRSGTRGFWEGWSRPGDGFVWTITVPRAGDYDISIVGAGGEGRPTVEVAVGGKVFRRRLGARWERLPVGRARLPAGRSTISLRSAGRKQMNRFISLEVVRPAVYRDQRRRAEAARANTSWLVEGIYGLMFHWTPRTCPRRGARKPYHQAVADFAVEPFARMVANTGAGHVYLTTAHCDHYFPGPNAAIDRILPGRTCKRDLIGELAEALEARGVRLGLYYHLGHEDKDWWDRVGWDTAGRATFYRAWRAVIEDAGLRYGRRLAGWWFDDGLFSYYPINPPWEKLLAAARAGNPDRVILWNAWNAPKVTDFADTSSWDDFLTERLITGGGHLPVGGSGRFTGGPQEGLQAHITTLIQRSWEHNRPNSPVGRCLYTTPRLISWIRQAARRRSVVTLNLEIFQDGTISPGDVRRFRAIRRAIKPDLRGGFIRPVGRPGLTGTSEAHKP